MSSLASGGRPCRPREHWRFQRKTNEQKQAYPRAYRQEQQARMRAHGHRLPPARIPVRDNPTDSQSAFYELQQIIYRHNPSGKFDQEGLERYMTHLLNSPNKHKWTPLFSDAIHNQPPNRWLKHLTARQLACFIKTNPAACSYIEQVDPSDFLLGDLPTIASFFYVMNAYPDYLEDQHDCDVTLNRAEDGSDDDSEDESEDGSDDGMDQDRHVCATTRDMNDLLDELHEELENEISWLKWEKHCVVNKLEDQRLWSMGSFSSRMLSIER